MYTRDELIDKLKTFIAWVVFGALLVIASCVHDRMLGNVS